MWKLVRLFTVFFILSSVYQPALAQEFFEELDSLNSVFDYGNETDSGDDNMDLYDEIVTGDSLDLEHQIQDSESYPKSIGFNLGGQLFNGDIEWTKAGWSEAIEVFFKIPLTNRFFIRPAIGYGSLSDGSFHFDKSYFYTSMFSFDLCAGVNLFKLGSKMNNFGYAGLGLANFMYDGPLSDFDPRLKDRITATSFFIGGGFEYNVKPKLNIIAQADYRFANTDLFEGMDRSANDGYGNIRFGISYTLGDVISYEDEKLLADFENGKLFDDLNDSSSDDFLSFEEGLDEAEQTEAASGQVSEYMKLKSRIEQLNDRIRQKEAEIYELKSQLDYKAQKLAELQQNIKTTFHQQAPISYSNQTSSSSYNANPEIGDFVPTYEEGLRQFYARSYEQSIYIFNSLLEINPQHRLASNCQYWIGECYFGMQNYGNAIEAFKHIFSFNKSSKFDDSLLMIARCMLVQGDNSSAKHYLEQLLNDYPESEYASIAENYLGKL